jgi:hypothetical protein
VYYLDCALLSAMRRKSIGGTGAAGKELAPSLIPTCPFPINDEQIKQVKSQFGADKNALMIWPRGIGMANGF